MDADLDILIDEDGDIAAVHDDLLEGLFDDGDGDIEIRRASHVEPATSIGWSEAGWIADMRPVNGPILHDGFVPGAPHSRKRPFATRAAALAAEREWLRVELGL